MQELRQKLAQYSAGASEHENAVFSHLLTFFSRYYQDGDFISQRRYKGDTYAIPYAGEEVMLHWAKHQALSSLALPLSGSPSPPSATTQAGAFKATAKGPQRLGWQALPSVPLPLRLASR